jgi:uncharacterized protein involved in outer membrane biogenesis
MTTLHDSWKKLTWWQKSLAVAACCTGLYALFGFLLVPRIARYVLVEKISQTLQRNISVAEIRCNPFALTADITGFTLHEKDEPGEFVAFDTLHANLELSSLFRLAAVVRDIRLDGPRLHIRLNEDGQTNFADLTATNETASTESEPTSSIIPFIVEPFIVGNGTIVLEDRIKNVTHVVDRIEFQVPHVSSRKKDWETYTTPTLSFRFNGAPFNLQGQTIPFHNSLKTEFTFDMVDLGLSKYWTYVPAREELQLAKGSLALQSKLSFEQHEDSLPTFSLQGTVTGSDIELTDNGVPVLSAVRTEIVMDDISILNLQLGLRSVTLEEPFLKVVRQQDGALNWIRYFTPEAAENATVAENVPEKTDSPAAKTRQVLLQAPRIHLSGGRIHFRDETLSTPFTKEIAELDIAVTDLDTTENATTQTRLTARTADNEEIEAELSFSVSPLRMQARFNGRNLDLPTYAPYFQAALPLTLAAAKADARIGLVLDGADHAPRLEDSSLELRDMELNAGSDGVRIKRLALDGIGLDMAAHTVRTGVLTLDGTTVTTGQDKFGRATLLAALQGNATSAQPADNAPAPDNATAWTVQAEGLAVSNLALQISGAKTQTPARVNAFKAGPLVVDTGAQTATVGSLDLSFGLDLVRLKNGDINLATFFAEPGQSKKGSAKTAAKPAKPGKTTSPTWSARIEQAALSASSVAFTDETLAIPMRLDLDQIALTTKNLSTDLTKAIPLDLSCRVEESGSIKASGSLTPATLAGKGSLNLSKIPVSLASAYVADLANIDIPSGSLSGKMTWRLDPKAGDQLGGTLRLDGLRITEGKSKNEIAGLKSLEVRDLAVRMKPLNVTIKEVTLIEPRGAFLIDDKGGTTFTRITPKAGSKPADKPTPASQATAPAETLTLDIASISLKQGRFSFADKTLSPQFESVISPVDLQVGGFSLDPSKRTELDLTAIIDGSAPVTMKGWVSPMKDPFEANSTVTLRNLDLVALSPYSSKFIAYPVTRGQLDWDMKLSTESSNLAMGNAIKARQLELGEKVESPDAADVPVKLGLALLRDMSGDVSINLPVKGDLNDPQFNIGGIVMQAFLGLIVKAITSPFSLLASLVPDGGDRDMSKIPFPAGLATPAPETLTALQALADILSQRPELKVAIVGHAAPEADRAAMEEMAFRRKMQVIKYDDLSRKEREKTRPEDLEITQEEYAELLWEAYKDEPVEKEKNAIGMHKEVSREVQEAKLKELIQITDEDLVRLAASRAEFVKTHLVQDLKADAARVFLGQTGPQALSGQHEVTLEVQQ